MKQIISIFLIVIIIAFWGCTSDKKNQINPLDNLKRVDNLLAEIAETPQILTIPSNSDTKVTGKKGTVIHVNPNQLETVDGTPLGENIQIELIEMTNKTSLLFNNAPTVSNGKLLVTGGAYYLNMSSGGRQLRIKGSKGIKVEFPRLTDDKMSLFLGTRDSIGQINWIQAKQNFKDKKLQKPKKPELEKVKKQKTGNEIESLLSYIKDKQETPLTQKELDEFKRREKEYERLSKEYETASKTYESIELLNFGWINCDRFLNDPSPKTNIQLLVNNDSLSGARMYAVFSDIRSMMTADYWRGMQDTVSFKNVPIGKKITIIALSAKNRTPYIFEKTINTEMGQRVEIEFRATTQKEVQKRIQEIN